MSFLTIAEASAKLAAKSVSPVELTQQCLAQIESFDPTLHAFITVTEARAMADAKAAEARIMAGKSLGPLDGIPIGLKDIIDTKGILTSCHSAQLIDNVPDADASCAIKLAEAGTILMGKLSTHEFANGGPSFDLPWPPARNPWNPDHFTAGSSSGTGAAVPSGMILGGLGTDTGGSIRGPAALCGIAGIKPTYGRVSRAGVSPAAFSLDHIGPMAWTTEDCAMMLQVLAGHDTRDPASAKVAVPNYTEALPLGAKGLKIGVIHHFHEVDNKVSDGTQKGIDDAIATFRGLGAEIREVTIAPLQPVVDEPVHHWRGLCASDPPPARAMCRAGFGDRRRGRAADGGAGQGGTQDRQRATMGKPGASEFHHAVQCIRLSRDVDLLRLWRRWSSGGDAVGGQAVC
jgi:aspartyl-tRNA(Asn)/glutamyl-tRNA(Gln) amidotransferase subunit A